MYGSCRWQGKKKDEKETSTNAGAAIKAIPKPYPTTSLLLGGSWVAISGVIGPPIYIINIVTLLITPTYSYP